MFLMRNWCINQTDEKKKLIKDANELLFKLILLHRINFNNLLNNAFFHLKM